MESSKDIGAFDRPLSKSYDLEERTFLFARNVRNLAKRLEKTICNREDARR